jgi:hypothetical protein
MSFPDEGLHFDVPFPAYLALDAVNSSLLRDIMRHTPRRVKFFRDHSDSRKVSDAMLLGSAVNHRLLEAGMSLDTIAVWRERKANGHMMPMAGPKFEAFKAANPGRLLVKATHWDQAGYIAAGVRRNSKAWGSLRNRRGTEVTLVWRRQGRLCKARLDWLQRDYWFDDLKVTGRPIAKEDFVWHAWRQLWHTQAAWYREGLEALGIDCPGCSVVPVEDSPPHECTVYDWPEKALEEGYERNVEAFDKLVECEESGIWPGHKERELLDAGPWKDDDAGLGGPKVDFGDIPT